MSADEERMIRRQIIDRGLVDPNVLAAMRGMAREKFVAAEQRDLAYADGPLPIGFGQTISQPYMVALMTHHLDVRSGHRVLEIGTGSGYQTAILSLLAAEVFSIERVEPLILTARQRLESLGLANIHFRHGDGTAGWAEAAPFDRVLIAAAARVMPRRLLLEQLVEGGVAVLPVGEEAKQTLVQVRKIGTRLEITDICFCRFVDLIGVVE
jgi:protein-L-isoaspartate(D-aspartate) O-methyltransferase